MLVLMRHCGERICVGDGIIITVVDAYKGKARIGIKAPADVPVDREEIRLRKQADQPALIPSARPVACAGAAPTTARRTRRLPR